MGTSIQEIYRTAKEMGAKLIDCGINWDWAVGFKTKEQAQAFETYAIRNGCETRGVCEDKHNKKACYSVRFR